MADLNFSLGGSQEKRVLQTSEESDRNKKQQDTSADKVTTGFGQETVDNFVISWSRAPGRTVQRQYLVTGKIGYRQVSGGQDNKKRDDVPPPLCSGKTEAGEEIGELKEFDRGHLVALSLQGVNSHWTIAPMVRHLNRHGMWSRMEEFLRQKVERKGNPIPKSKKTSDTVNTVQYRIAVSLLYNDRQKDGKLDEFCFDTRVPVWFYVRVTRDDKLVAFFSMANRCALDEDPSELDEQHKIEFLAADDMYDQMIALGRLPARDPLRPYQVLQFMHDVNTQEYKLVDEACIKLSQECKASARDVCPSHPALVKVTLSGTKVTDAGALEPLRNKAVRTEKDFARRLIACLDQDTVKSYFEAIVYWCEYFAKFTAQTARIFQTMETTTFGPRTAFTKYQRSIMMRYNRWRNWRATGVASMTSDADADNKYPQEKKDIYPVMQLCGGRDFPEADHIIPSYQQGTNRFDNCRMVSFVHNHIYREKKQSGSRPVAETLLQLYEKGELRFTGTSWHDCLAGKSTRTLRCLNATATKLFTRFDNAPARESIVSEDVVEERQTVADFLARHYADDKILQKNTDFFNKSEPEGIPFHLVKTALSQSSGIDELIRDRQEFLNAQARGEKTYQYELANSGNCLAIRQLHNRAVDDFHGDSGLFERLQKMLISDQKSNPDFSKIFASRWDDEGGWVCPDWKPGTPPSDVVMSTTTTPSGATAASELERLAPLRSTDTYKNLVAELRKWLDLPS